LDRYECLKLENQICFPLYACAKEVVRQYRKPLEAMNLTYTQYVVMLAFWEYGGMTEKELGKRVHLDSGTLAPLLKRLEKLGYVDRMRPESNERKLYISLTEKGEALKQDAAGIPQTMSGILDLTPEETAMLRSLLNKVFKSMKDQNLREAIT
jgi:DNA-binding MarR family transcriptional regulator